MQFLLRIDEVMSSIISRSIPHIPVLDAFFSFFSLVGGSFFVWFVLMGIVLLIEERHDKRTIPYFLVSFSLAYITVSYVLKDLFGRIRPIFVLPIHELYTTSSICPADHSFPSGHAATSFAAAYILSRFDKKRIYLYYTVAFLISFSRLYLQCHYLLDVIAGGLIGTLISFLILRIKISYKKKSNHVHKK